MGNQNKYLMPESQLPEDLEFVTRSPVTTGSNPVGAPPPQGVDRYQGASLGGAPIGTDVDLHRTQLAGANPVYRLMPASPSGQPNVNSGVHSNALPLVFPAISAANKAQATADAVAAVSFQGPWQSGEFYQQGASVDFGGKVYVSLINNNGGNQPDVSPSDWVPAGGTANFAGVWNSSTAYTIGQTVSVGTSLYIALQNSTNQNPASTSGFWQLLSNSSVFFGAWNSSTQYSVGGEVLNNGSYWIATTANINRPPQPGSSFWVNVGTSAILLTNYNAGTAYSIGMEAVGGDGNVYSCIAATTGNAPPNASFWQLVGPASLDSVADGTIYIRGIQYQSQTMVVPNANFEASASLPVPGWAATGATLSYETSSPFAGTQSLKVAAVGQFGGAESVQKWAAAPGDQFYLSCAVKSDGTGVATPEIQFRDQANTFLGAVQIGSTSTSWTTVTASGTAPAGTTQAFIGLFNNAVGGAGTVWFDNVVADRITILGKNVGDGPSNFSATASTLTYRPTTNPLTAIDAGSSSTVNIAAFTMRTSSKGDISINSGSVTALSYGTLNYIYYDDSTLAGGGVTYNATTTKETAINGVGRFYVGSIITPLSGGSSTTGNNDGGTGAQFGQFQKIFFSSLVFNQLSSAGFNSPTTNANDGSDVTSCQLTTIRSGQSTVRGSQAQITLSLPPIALNLFQTAVLRIKSSSNNNTANPINGSATGATLAYSLDGASFTTIYSTTSGVTRALTIDSVTLTSPLNLGRIKVQATVSNLANPPGDCTQELYEAWLEVTA